MFEKAARMKLRFNFKGVCSVEDLWDLSVGNLDSIFKSLSKKLKEVEGESLLKEDTKEDKILELKVTVIKHIVTVKLEEKKNRDDRLLKAEKKQKLLSIIAGKEEDNFKDMSVESLKALVNNL